MEEELLTIWEACELLKCSRSTLAKFIERGLPYIDLDFGRKRFLKSSIFEFFRENQKRQGSGGGENQLQKL